ncbi:hypothetical protein A3B64_00925 [candidate division WWE3 bacterium RIFCSPLOWO2_01_FULL_37_24]|uniref:Uncharacterized protein n=1 Tax=candidate division WWE3 bacterium RIFCSPHIGHO2_02_FULL_38_14 TaxID=1802620 RepID=A0A1F4V9P2_UNCKA|nr:MAG: hypothetical protein A3B64_00925 [candidate division WWE3 bacterium RIFCSPLOWO2_01_FULL_37_24]OGC53917.1 MAG: hypothetical protein A3D91_03980 [candidate division WWE3 bacterium RIFCSPHIGHO2_02_FULL_38_14]
MGEMVIVVDRTAPCFGEVQENCESFERWVRKVIQNWISEPVEFNWVRPLSERDVHRPLIVLKFHWPACVSEPNAFAYGRTIFELLCRSEYEADFLVCSKPER